MRVTLGKEIDCPLSNANNEERCSDEKEGKASFLSRLVPFSILFLLCIVLTFSIAHRTQEQKLTA